jgi:hypothetical protein
VGVGVSALLVPEKLAFKEIRGDVGAGDGHERPVPPCPTEVYPFGKYSLAGTTLPEDQNAGIALGHS